MQGLVWFTVMMWRICVTVVSAYVVIIGTLSFVVKDVRKEILERDSKLVVKDILVYIVAIVALILVWIL